MQRTIALGPESGPLDVRTGRQGIAAGIGYDLTLRALSWEAGAAVDLADSSVCSVRVEVHTESLTVVRGSGGLKPLTELEKHKIHVNTSKILRTAQFPAITFQSTIVTGSPDAFTIDGQLEIMGRSEPVTVTGKLAGGRASGSTTLKQSDWGIKPFSSLFGTLKLADEVTVEFDLEIPPP